MAQEIQVWTDENTLFKCRLSDCDTAVTNCQSVTNRTCVIMMPHKSIELPVQNYKLKTVGYATALKTYTLIITAKQRYDSMFA